LADGLGEAAPHLLAVRRDPRLLADQDAVGVDETPTGFSHLGVGLPEEVEGRAPLEPILAGRKQAADIAEPSCAEQRIHQRVCDHVAVGVPGKTARVVELDSAY